MKIFTIFSLLFILTLDASTKEGNRHPYSCHFSFDHKTEVQNFLTVRECEKFCGKKVTDPRKDLIISTESKLSPQLDPISCFLTEVDKKNRLPISLNCEVETQLRSLPIVGLYSQSMNFKPLFFKAGDRWVHWTSLRHKGCPLLLMSREKHHFFVTFDRGVLADFDAYISLIGRQNLNYDFIIEESVLRRLKLVVPDRALTVLRYGNQRPYVVTNSKPFSDPQIWKRTLASAERETKFLEKLGKLNVPLMGPKPRSIKADAREVLRIKFSYLNQRGDTLLGFSHDHSKLRIPKDYEQEFSESDSPSELRWFLYTYDGKILEMKEKAMLLVDAGDYDLDGNSEFLFYKSGDESGYNHFIIATSDLSKTETFGITGTAD